MKVKRIDNEGFENYRDGQVKRIPYLEYVNAIHENINLKLLKYNLMLKLLNYDGINITNTHHRSIARFAIHL